MKRLGLLLLISFFIAFATFGCTAADKSTLKMRDAVDAARQGDMVKYKALVTEAHNLNPNDVFVINNMGAVYEMDNNKAEAIAHYKECVDKAGDLKVAKGGDPAWEGKPLKDLCAANLKRVQQSK